MASTHREVYNRLPELVSRGTSWAPLSWRPKLACRGRCFSEAKAGWASQDPSSVNPQLLGTSLGVSLERGAHSQLSSPPPHHPAPVLFHTGPDPTAARSLLQLILSWVPAAPQEALGTSPIKFLRPQMEREGGGREGRSLDSCQTDRLQDQPGCV